MCVCLCVCAGNHSIWPETKLKLFLKEKGFHQIDYCSIFGDLVLVGSHNPFWYSHRLLSISLVCVQSRRERNRERERESVCVCVHSSSSLSHTRLFSLSLSLSLSLSRFFSLSLFFSHDSSLSLREREKSRERERERSVSRLVRSDDCTHKRVLHRYTNPQPLDCLNIQTCMKCYHRVFSEQNSFVSLSFCLFHTPRTLTHHIYLNSRTGGCVRRKTVMRLTNVSKSSSLRYIDTLS